MAQLPPAIQRQLERHLGEVIIKVRSVGGGSISQAVRLTTAQRSYFAKWNAQGSSDQFDCEARGLEALAYAQESAAYPLLIPRPLYVSTQDEHEEEGAPPLMLMEWIETGRVGADFDEQLGAGLANLHRVSAPRFGLDYHTYCGVTRQENAWRDRWEEFYAEQRLAPLIREACDHRGLAGEDLRRFEVLIRRLSEWITTDESPALIHGDLWYGNVLETASGPPALIDPAVSYAHREAELGMMELFGGFSPRVWSTYQAHYPLTSGWRERLPLYTLYHVLNHFVIFGGRYGDEACRIARRFVG